MLEITKTLSLCSTCKHSQQCTLSGGNEKPVFYCEEFDFDRPVATTVANPCQDQSSSANSKDKTKYTGLCSDCENRKDCCFAKAEGGVWHCQEYR